MSEEQKVWFVYLTDHHEGPFTPAEVAEKLAQGAVNAQSLGWKDGMPEWLPLESISELAAVIHVGATAPAPTEAPAAAGGGEDFSLAQLLASQQQGGAAPPAEESMVVSSASVLSEITGAVNVGAAMGGGTELSLGDAPGGGSEAVSPTDEVWTLRLGRQVTGLHSIQSMIQLAGEGEIPADAKVWRPGWTDFQLVSSLPEVMQARRPRKSLGPSGGGLGRGTGGISRPAFAPITAGSDVGDDEPTNPGIKAPGGLLQRIGALFKPKKAKAEKGSAFGKPSAKKAGGGAKRLLLPLSALVLLGLGAAAYFLLLASPIPSDLDVSEEEREQMVAVVKQSQDQGVRFVLALARGTEEDPPDETAPKFYVATNLPEGTPVSLHIVGKPGTLVNRYSFEQTVSSTVGSSRVGAFPPLQDDGKPLPMGEYVMTISADGAEPLMVERFLGGKKGGAYQSRLKKYKEKLQADYDKEMQELKQYVDTLKSLQGEIAKRGATYRSGWAVAANRPKILADWQAFSTSATGLLAQVDAKLKAHATAAAETQVFHPRAFQDVASTLAQLQQWMQMHGERLRGGIPSVNLDELEGLVQAGVVSLEQWLAQALVKNPMDVLGGSGENPPPPAAATPAAPPAESPQGSNGG